MALRTPDQLQGEFRASFPEIHAAQSATPLAPCILSVLDLNKRKKRRIDGNSPALSDISFTSSARASPAPAASGLDMTEARTGSTFNTSIIVPVEAPSRLLSPHPETPQPQTVARAPGGRPLTKKERRDNLSSQLPLKEGRPIAFRPPGKAQSKGSRNEGGSTDWIQARVVKCIQGDKNR